MKKRKNKDRFFQKERISGRAWLLGVLFGISAFLSSTALGIGVIMMTDQPFKRDISALQLVSQTRMSRQVILRNYRAMIEYLSPFSKKEWSLPDLKWSPEGASHFADCKVLFLWIYIIGFIAFLACVYFIWRALSHRLYRGTLLVSGVVTIAFPVIILTAMIANFNAAFVLMHKILFNNDNWLFDPKTDPIINMLPEEFFFHCALTIAAFWVIFAAVQFILHTALSGSAKTRR